MCLPSSHAFVPHPTEPLLYCARCGDVRSVLATTLGIASSPSTPPESSLSVAEPAEPASEGDHDAAIYQLIEAMKSANGMSDEDPAGLDDDGLLAKSNRAAVRRIPVDQEGDDGLPAAGL